MEFNPSSIKTDELTYALYKEGQKKAKLEREWVVKEHQRQIILNEMAKQQAGLSATAALIEARVSPEYKDHVIEMGDCKGNLIIARARYDAIDHEIRMRLAKQYEQRQEYKAGSIQT